MKHIAHFFEKIEIELHKPKAYAMVQIQDTIATCFGGDYVTPAAMVTVESITSTFDNISNKSKQIASALQKIGGIPSSRIYVHYVTATEKNFSYKI